MGDINNMEAPTELRQRATATSQPSDISESSAMEHPLIVEDEPRKEKKTMGKTPSGEGEQIAPASASDWLRPVV